MKITLKELRNLNGDLQTEATKQVHNNLFSVVVMMGGKKAIFMNVYGESDTMFSAKRNAEIRVERLLCDLDIAYANYCEYGQDKELCPMVKLEFKSCFHHHSNPELNEEHEE